MIQLSELVAYCDQRARTHEVKDFSGALNGLQFANDGMVTKIGAAVDAGLVPFQKAVDAKIDFLIVHHGMFWMGQKHYVGPEYEKMKTLVNGNLAVYSCHLPLDAHREIGNNAILAKKLGIEATGSFLPYEGTDIGLLGSWKSSRADLRAALKALFGQNFSCMEFGSKEPRKICVLTGSGASAVEHIKSTGADTFVTGELRQHHFNYAQENGLNIYACGHYATETFGVAALAAEAAKKFGLKWEFIKTECPL
ncbi:Nif3-like dinuclear metal center hexameric protein [Pelagicoccus albus]|uniref:Nif3-like dinuclear metal center hexameric protein n=1 Tax=Pelagicoccus albus TaxID=415222 RepID=A0A7X1E741_9BACT|nr:Nif3-like dinuclear metal center hexameric protein [Pelagicoccus albus]MBC2604743.1 Nif3-like dinuclear metal center hexameric protein [Pelagicoccus albus]